MTEELKPDVKQAPTHDAQLAAENMTTGKEQAPKVDVAADYEASKAFSVSEIDRTPEGAKAAASATNSKFEIPQTEEIKSPAKPTGNPEDYLDMAKDVNPRIK